MSIYASATLWFDVGIKRYTTCHFKSPRQTRLWFDVGIKRYTTFFVYEAGNGSLWFDVGIKRYTTHDFRYILALYVVV